MNFTVNMKYLKNPIIKRIVYVYLLPLILILLPAIFIYVIPILILGVIDNLLHKEV